MRRKSCRASPKCFATAPPCSWSQLLEMIQSRAQVTVRYAETDMMGIVYHGNYLPWFEIGRTTLLKEQGLPYRQLEADGYRLPVLEIGAKYHRPALYDDTLTIVTTMREKPSLRIRLEYEILNGDVL